MTDARLEIEALLKCPTCEQTVYKLFRRSSLEHPEIFTHVLWPAQQGVAPPMDTARMICPTDGTALQRVAG